MSVVKKVDNLVESMVVLMEIWKSDSLGELKAAW